jgi:hypothetical protein
MSVTSVALNAAPVGAGGNAVFVAGGIVGETTPAVGVGVVDGDADDEHAAVRSSNSSVKRRPTGR